MKKLLLLFIALFSLQTGKAQSWIGDSTNLETNLSLINLDTASENIWQIGSPQKTFFGTSYSAPNSIMTDSINPYPINNLSRFTVALFDSTSGLMSIELGFWHKFESDSLKDGGYVEISIDSGATWENVATQDIAESYNSTNFYSGSDTIAGNIPAFTGTRNSWQYSRYRFAFIIPVLMTINNDNKSASGGGREVFTHGVMFRFNFKSDNIETNKAGWIIDNITIKPYDLGGGVHENEMVNFNVQLFPNPIDEQGIIQVVPENNERDFTIAIYNNIGELVAKSPIDKNNQYIIKRNELISGMYFYSVFSKTGGIRNGKLIIK